MNQKPIAPGAIGVWLDSSRDGELYGVTVTLTHGPRTDPSELWIRTLDGGPELCVPAERFWCLLDAGVLPPLVHSI